MQRWWRLRALLEKRYVGLVVFLLALALVGGWVTYGAYADPGTTTTERNVSSWSMTGNYNHSAMVTEENPVEPVGTMLSERPIYLTSISPIATGVFTFQYTASDSGNLDTSVTVRSVVRSVESDEESSTEVWRDTRDLKTRSRNNIGPGTSVTVPFSIDVPQAKNRTERIESSLGNPPGEPQFVVVTTVSLSGTVNGQDVNTTEEYVLPVTFENGGYRLSATAETREFGSTETVTIPQRPGTFESVGGPLVLICSLAALAGLAWKRQDLALSDAERNRLRFQDDRDTMEEWINEMRLPDEIHERPQIAADSLTDLVDFAIDTNNSVIQDDGYYVLHDGMLYTYEPPESGLPLSDDGLTEQLPRSNSNSDTTDSETTTTGED